MGTGKFWQKALEEAIVNRKRRIKILEKHGVGLEVIKEKAQLLKSENSLRLMKQ